MKDDSGALQQFTGVARLFPLPNVVLFPHVIQPLHIFEPRYRQMTADALTDDRLIASALLRPGWETDYEGRPAIYPTVCLGHIVNEQCLPDGRFNFLLRGLSRGRVIGELSTDKLFRSATVELQCEVANIETAVAAELRGEIERAVLPWFPAEGPAVEQLQKLLHSQLALGMLCDLLGFAVPLEVEAKQRLLEELDVGCRARQLVQLLTEHDPPLPKPRPKRKFPPDFSGN